MVLDGWGYLKVMVLNFFVGYVFEEVFNSRGGGFGWGKGMVWLIVIFGLGFLEGWVFFFDYKIRVLGDDKVVGIIVKL